MISLNRSNNSCGILEVNGIGNRKTTDVLKELYRKMRGTGSKWSVNSAFITFSDVVKNGSVQALRDYMIENKFKNVTYLNEVKNPNSGNVIGFLIWEFDNKALTRWYKKYMASIVKPEHVRKFTVTGNHCGHGMYTGDVVTMRYDDDGEEESDPAGFYFEERSGNYIYFDEVEEIIGGVVKEVEEKVEKKVYSPKIFTWR